MATNADIKFSSITIDDLTPGEAFTGTTSVTLAILSYLYFNDNSKYSQILSNLKCYLVNINEYGETVDSINISGIQTRIMESGEGTFCLEISLKDIYNLTFNNVGIYYIKLTTAVDDNVIEILSTEGINIKSKLSVNANINVKRVDDTLSLDISVNSNNSISSYPNVPTVQIQFFTENKQYNTIAITEDGTSVNYVSEKMNSEIYTYSHPNILLTKIGKLNNLFVRLIVSLNMTDKLVFDKNIPVEVIYDVFDNGENRGFALGKYCDEDKTIFECDFPAKFNSSVIGIGIINYIYPVGTYYHTDNENFNPNLEWLGTKWELLNDGRFLLGSGPDYPVTVDGTSNIGGKATHTLSESQLPKISKSIATSKDSHVHNIAYRTFTATGIKNQSGTSFSKPISQSNTSIEGRVNSSSDEHAHTVKVEFGSGSAHNNMPPYRVVNIWHRIS